MRRVANSIWIQGLAVGLSVLLIPLSLWYAAQSARALPSFHLTVSSGDLRFSGQEAYGYARSLALGFPHRSTGAPNNLKAAQWLAEQFASLGLAPEIDSFTNEIYSRPAELHNVVAVKPGQSSDAIVITAHLDQATTTVQGADNDASGIGIMMELARVFATEPSRYTLIFLANDAEEYGMLGSKHFIDNYDGRVVAAVSLDNAGRKGATAMQMAPIGQGRGYTDLWLVRLTQDLALRLGLWRPDPPGALFQVLERSVLISFTDQGPFLTHGIPAFGFGAGGIPWPYYHSPTDTIDRIAPETMAQIGLLTESLVRELNGGVAVDSAAPAIASGALGQHYLYFDRDPVGRTSAFIPGTPLRLVQLALILPFLLVSLFAALRAWRSRGLDGFGTAALRLLSNAAVPVAGILSLYLMEAIGLMPGFEFYPATPLDPVLYSPRWGAVAIFLLVVTAASWIAGSRVAIRTAAGLEAAEDWRRPLAYLTLSLVAVGVYLVNGYTLLFLLPALYLWPLMPARRFASVRFLSPALGVLLFVAGGLFLYALLYQYGQQIFLGWYILWYLLMMLSTGMVAPYTALAASLAIGAGVSLAAPVMGATPQVKADPQRTGVPLAS